MNLNHPFLKLSVRPWGLLTASGVVACGATALGFLGSSFWILDLFTHFRVQYMLGLGLLAVVMLFARRWKTAGLFLVFAASNLMFILPLYFSYTPTTQSSGHPFRTMLINVNSRTGDADLVKQVIEKYDPHLLVLEEITARWAHDLSWLTNSYPYSCVQSREDNFGIGLFSKHPIVERSIEYIGDADVPSILATMAIEGTPLHVVATHPLPPAGPAYTQWRNEQLALLPTYIDPSQTTILMGDLNVTPWNPTFRKLLNHSGLRDSTRGYGIQPSWPSFSPFLRIPIDHCLYSPNIRVINRRVGEAVNSDHYPLIVDFDLSTKQ